MFLIQLTGLSGAGKSSIANSAKAFLKENHQLDIMVIDADEYRKTINKDLGFSKADRIENIRRLGKLGAEFTSNGIITIIAAINPYESARQELRLRYNAKTVWINCSTEVLVKRDTKRLYKRAMLEENNLNRINNLTGINDPYELPCNSDLVINTEFENLATSSRRLVDFINRLHTSPQSLYPCI